MGLLKRIITELKIRKREQRMDQARKSARNAGVMPPKQK